MELNQLVTVRFIQSSSSMFQFAAPHSACQCQLIILMILCADIGIYYLWYVLAHNMAQCAMLFSV